MARFSDQTFNNWSKPASENEQNLGVKPVHNALGLINPH
jgi:hypothetical protein